MLEGSALFARRPFFGFLGSYGMQIWSEAYFPVLPWMGSDDSKRVMLANLSNTLSEGFLVRLWLDIEEEFRKWQLQ